MYGQYRYRGQVGIFLLRVAELIFKKFLTTKELRIWNFMSLANTFRHLSEYHDRKTLEEAQVK